MDSRVKVFAVGLFAVLVLIGVVRHYAGKWFKAHPVWAIVATAAVFVGCFLVVTSRFDVTGYIECLQSRNVAACMFPVASANAGQS